MDREIEKALASCLDTMKQGESLEDSLARYPHLAGELEPLLRTAFLVRQATRLEARPGFKVAVRHRLLASLEPSQHRFWWQVFSWPRRWAVALASLLVVFLGWGTVTLANNSLPDQPMYPVKIATEEVRRAVTPNEVGKARLEMELAERRTYEITELARVNRPQPIEQASMRLARHLERFALIAAAQGEQPASAQVDLEALLERRAAHSRALLEGALPDTPASARPALGRALERSQAGYQEARQEIRKAKQGPHPKFRGPKSISQGETPAPKPEEDAPLP